MSWVARTLGFCRQTIYNEIERGTYIHTCDYWDEKRYSADKGQQIHDRNQAMKGRSLKIGNDRKYADFLETKMLGIQEDGKIDRRKRCSPAAALALARREGFQTSVCALPRRKVFLAVPAENGYNEHSAPAGGSRKTPWTGKERKMSFFDELTQKAKVVAATASEKAREAADSAKISAAIIAEKRELDKNYRAVGQWYACEHLEGEVPEAIADVIAAVKASQEKITQLQELREAKEAEEAAGEPEGKVCPVCGKISETKFCPNCGAPMGE